VEDMANINTIKRYALILEKLKPPFYSSLDEIQSFLEIHSLYPSKRTLERDLNTLRERFGIKIVYNRHSDTYHYREYDELDGGRLFNLIEYVNTFSLYQDNKHLQYLSFQRLPSHSGSSYLNILLKAIQERQKVQIDYRPYYGASIRNFTVHPYLLKQFNLRWYIYCYVQERDDRRTLALDDRMLSLKVSGETYDEYPREVLSAFKNVVGVSDEQHNPVRIKIKVNQRSANYLKSIPLHSSQIIENETDDYTVFSVEVVNNFELRQAILKMGRDAEVLEPEELKNDIIEELKQMINTYS